MQSVTYSETLSVGYWYLQWRHPWRKLMGVSDYI